MEEFPSNSSRARGRQEKADPKKIEKVIQGNAVIRKKPLGRRIKHFVIGDQGVMEYLRDELILPAFRDLFVDTVNFGMERRMYGETRSTSRRTGRRPGSDYVAYNRYSRDRRDDPRDREREPARGRRGRSIDIDEIVIPTRVEAEELIDQMFDVLREYDVVSVSDLYGMAGLNWDYPDAKYGWESLEGARVQRVQNGYLLDLPRPEPLR